MHVSIGKAVDWIAQNDDVTELEMDTIQFQITTLLIADLFGKEPEDIARRIVERRKELKC